MNFVSLQLDFNSMSQKFLTVVRFKRWVLIEQRYWQHVPNTLIDALIFMKVLSPIKHCLKFFIKEYTQHKIFSVPLTSNSIGNSVVVEICSSLWT